jgi:hypothetical protein
VQPKGGIVIVKKLDCAAPRLLVPVNPPYKNCNTQFLSHRATQLPMTSPPMKETHNVHSNLSFHNNTSIPILICNNEPVIEADDCGGFFKRANPLAWGLD